MTIRTLPFSRVSQTLCLLALITASAAMAICLTFVVENMDAFLIQNVLDDDARKALLYVPLGSGLVVTFTAAIFCWLRGSPAFERLVRIVRVLAPGWLLWAVPVLTSYGAWKERPLEFLLLLSAFALALERTFRVSFSALPQATVQQGRKLLRWGDSIQGRRVLFAIVVVSCAAYSGYFSFHTVQEHHRLTTGPYDLGIGDSLMANMLAGEFFRVPALLPDGSSMLKGHALFAAFLYLPFYAIYPSSEALLVIQSVMMGFAALPLYLFAATQLPRFYALIVALCFLMTPILHGPNFYDFHFLSTAPIFHFLLYLGIAKKKHWFTASFWLVLVALREDISMSLIPLGCVLAVSGVRVRTGLVMAGASLVVFIVVKFVIMPAAGTWFFSNHYAGLFVPGQQSYGSAIITTLSNPTKFLTSLLTLPKLVFLLHIFGPLLFLSWRSPWILVASLGAFPSTFMVTDGRYVTDIGFQYVTHWLPYLFGGAVVALVLMKSKKVRMSTISALVATSCAVLLHSWVFGAVLQKNSFSAAAKPIPLAMTKEERAEYRALTEIRAMIPPQAIVSASPVMYPHISNRTDAYALENGPDGNPEYLLINPRLVEKIRGSVKVLRQQASYGLLAKRRSIYLFKRNHESEETARAFRDLNLGGTAGQRRAQPKRGAN